MRIKIKNINISPEDALYCITNKNTEEVKKYDSFLTEINGIIFEVSHLYPKKQF